MNSLVAIQKCLKTRVPTHSTHILDSGKSNERKYEDLGQTALNAIFQYFMLKEIHSHHVGVKLHCHVLI